MSAELSSDVAFGRFYGLMSVATQGCLLSFALAMRPSPEELGEFLCSPEFLGGLAAVLLTWVAAAKAISGHDGALSLPRYASAVRGDPARASTLLRRTVLRLKRIVFGLRPAWRLAEGAAMLGMFWALVYYLCVCFGAPFFSDQRETAAFSALLALLVLLPSLLVYGPEREDLRRIFLVSDLSEADPLAHLLFQNAVGSVVGAWFGAFPIPLDWDRPWQRWPITCCLGAVAGHAVSSVWSLLVITRQANKYVSRQLIFDFIKILKFLSPLFQVANDLHQA